MPLINGCKYSCEPCIRGHRATSCAHNDRVLIEVRRPGRPLESCGHEFATCNCGKITELLSMGSLLSDPTSEQGGPSQDSTLVVTSPPVASVATKSKDRTRGHRRVSKKLKKKKGESPPPSPSPSANRGSREASSMIEESEQNLNIHQPSFAYQDQIYSGGSGGLGSVTQLPSFPPYPSPPYQIMQSVSPMQSPQTFGPYQSEQAFGNPDGYQMAYSAQPHVNYSMGYSSRIEDIARSPSSQQESTDPNQPYIRSQYIMARQDSVWRAPR